MTVCYLVQNSTVILLHVAICGFQVESISRYWGLTQKNEGGQAGGG